MYIVTKKKRESILKRMLKIQNSYHLWIRNKGGGVGVWVKTQGCKK
jgi:hypothetical protein